MRRVREVPGPRHREVEPGGDGLGGDGTGLIKVPKILPLSFFRSTQRFGKEDFGTGDFPTPAGLTLRPLGALLASVQSFERHGLSAHDLRVPGFLDCAPREQGAFLKDAVTLFLK